MPLPPALRRAIDAEVTAVDASSLRRAAARLSESYRTGRFANVLSTPADRAAYLLTRMPATYASNQKVFEELAGRAKAPVRTVLDLGAGPGTAMWAAAEVLPNLAKLTAVERDRNLLEIGRRLAAHGEHPALRDATWLAADLQTRPDVPSHDLVVMAYAMGELGAVASVVAWAWKLANRALVIVEPGTPKAFQGVLAAREFLIAAGAAVAAPCPHHNACPLAVRDDWCHFRVRLQRSSEHRRLKGGDLGYEDEKFSYIIGSKAPAHQAEARIVRHPLKHTGHVKLTLCTPEGLQTPAITRSQKDLYRSARHAEWGDAWPPRQP